MGSSHLCPDVNDRSVAGEKSGLLRMEQWRRGAGTMDFRGHPVQVYEGGDPRGEPLLLIHGFPTAAWDWVRVWESLGRDFRLLAPDLLGFGFSAKPQDLEYSFPLQADLCEAVLASRSVERYHVLAHDYGDTVAQELLARRGKGTGAEGLRSVCLLNGGVFPERHQPRLIQRLLAGPLGPLLSRLIGKRQALRSLARVFGPDTQPGTTEREAMWQLIDHGDGRRVMPRLLGYIREREIHRDRWVGAMIESPVPLMFVDGLLDPVSGEHMVERWRTLLPRAPLVELPGIGHYPQLEAPDQVVAACVPFFRAVD